MFVPKISKIGQNNYDTDTTNIKKANF